MSNPTPEPEDPFVFARSKSTGETRSIPRAWLDHPVIGVDWELPADTEVDLSGSVGDVLGRVGDSKAHAEAYLTAEKAAKNRSTLVDGLQAVIDAAPTDDPADQA